MRSERQRAGAPAASRCFALWPESVILKACLQAENLVRSGAQCYAQAHIPTEPPSSGEDTRLFDAHEDQGGSSGAFPSSRQGSQARFCECRLPRLAQPSFPVTRVRAIPGFTQSPRREGMTRYFLHEAPNRFGCAAFSKESRMKFINAKKLHRKSGGTWGTRPVPSADAG